MILIDKQFYELSSYEVNIKGELVYVDDKIELPINVIINREDGSLPVLSYTP